MIQFLFQNEHFVLCDKPSGILSTPSRISDGRICLGLELEKELGGQIFPVHRLDYEVSGLVLYALNAKAHQQANHWFEKRLVHKTYRALTTAQDFSHIPASVANDRLSIDLVQHQDFEWQGCLLRGKKRSYESPHGKPTLTRAHFLGSKNSFLEWDLYPVTGRSHQLRFDLSRHGFPIVGDELYGSKVDFLSTQNSLYNEDTIALRAFKIDFSDCPEASSLGLKSSFEIENF